MIIRVHGTPAPQGSKRHVGHGVMIESSKKVKPWREAVKHAALGAMANHPGDLDNGVRWATIDGPVQILITFLLARPQGHYGTGRNTGTLKASAPLYPAVKPDLDKLIRSTLDALTDVQVYRDDSRVVALHVWKKYANDECPHGAEITVSELTA